MLTIGVAIESDPKKQIGLSSAKKRKTDDEW